MTPQLRAVRDSGWTYALLWALSRVWMWAAYSLYPALTHDVEYYFEKLAALPGAGIAGTMTEYPTPVVAGLDALLLATRTQSRFAIAFVLGLMLLDGLFAFFLWNSGGARRRTGAYFWLGYLMILAPLDLFRFDTLPAVFAGLALLWAHRRPRAAGGLVALGAGMKLWPALLILPTAAPRKTRIRALIGFGVVGVALALFSLLWSGWARTISPLTWQKERGLQIESIPATPVMLLHGLGSKAYRVGMSPFNAVEIWGPGRELLLKSSTLLTGLGGIAILLICYRLWRRQRVSFEAMAMTTLMIVLIMIITNKTLSPQYIIWLGGPIAAYLALHQPEPGEGRRSPLAVATIGTVTLACLTTVIYPWMYSALSGDTTKPAMALATLVLVARNTLLVVASVWAFWQAWRMTAREKTATSTVDSPRGRATTR